MRISFGGGGTDLEAYYAKYGGLVISTAINKYFYAIITTEDADDLQVISADYRSLFRHSPYNDLFWNGDLALPKAILHHFGIRRGINLFVASEVPPGTGLGSSSAAAVTMVRAISTLLEQPMTKQQVAELASSIEISKMGMPIGKQDQYAAAFGGLNKITFSSEGVTVEPLKIARDVLQTLENRLMLFFTGSSRESTSILKHQRKSTEDRDDAVLRALHHIKQVAVDVQAMSSRACSTIPGRRNAVSPLTSRPVSSMSAIAWRWNMGRPRAKLRERAGAASCCCTVRRGGRTPSPRH